MFSMFQDKTYLNEGGSFFVDGRTSSDSTGDYNVELRFNKEKKRYATRIGNIWNCVLLN